MLGRINVKERYKVQVALKYLRAKLTKYRSEERRKVRQNQPVCNLTKTTVLHNFSLRF